MNERIRELAEQAGLQLGIVLENSTTPVKTITVEQRKFAELIIQECISTLEEKIYRSIDNEGDEIWADLILKEHFGVEE